VQRMGSRVWMDGERKGVLDVGGVEIPHGPVLVRYWGMGGGGNEKSDPLLTRVPVIRPC